MTGSPDPLSGDIARALHSPEPFLAALASSNPVPGGGGVIALELALAAAQLAMLARLAAKKHEGVPALVPLPERFDAAWRAGVELVSRDAQAFGGWLAARRLPKATDAEKAARKAAIDQAQRTSCDIPLEIARRAADLAAPATVLHPLLDAAYLADLVIAAGAARAALDGAAALVRSNLEGSSVPWAGEVRAQLAAIAAEAHPLEALTRAVK